MTQHTDGREKAFTQLSVPSAYDAYCGPTLFEPWGQVLVDFAGIEAGASVLDVACGTGIVTRLAAQRSGPRGHVLGIDISAPMLSVARAKPPLIDGAPLDFTECSAFELKVADASQDVVICHQGLPFLPDRPAALREMRRVLKKGGTVAVALWVAERPLGLFGAIIDATAKVCPEPPFPNAYNTASFVMTAQELRDAFEAAGFAEVHLETRERDAVFASMDDVLRTIQGTPFGPAVAKLPADAQAKLREALTTAWTPHRRADGTVHIPTIAHLARSRK